MTFALDAAARAKRGINFGSWLTGTLPVKLKAPLSRASAEVEIDLTPAGIDNPVPGRLEAGGKAGQGDVRRQARRRKALRSATSPSTWARR